MIITGFLIYKIILFCLAIGLPFVYFLAKKKRIDWISKLIPFSIAIYGILQILILVYLFRNHLSFPLNLEGLELVRLQHVRRVLQGLPIFVEPTPQYIPLVYQPIYYYLTIPIVWLLGDTLFSLRLVSILGTIGASIILFLAVRDHTRSNWWALIAVGLFAAAYKAMDSYFDIASSDSWLICTTLFGCYLINKEKSWSFQLFGIMSLILSFWFKQHGAIFVFGALIFLTWRNGYRRALPFWIIAIIFGPILYFLAGPYLFGPEFIFFTQDIPRQWIGFTLDTTIFRVVKIIALNYLILGFVSVSGFFLQLRRDYHKINIWYFMLPLAILSGFLAAFVDQEGNNNIFMPMGVWLILTGVIGLKDLTDYFPSVERWGMHVLVIMLSFLTFVYNPRSEIIPTQAEDDYQELVTYLKSLDGTVYAPHIGPLIGGYEFHPQSNWITIYDLYRGSIKDDPNHSSINELLEPVMQPQGNAYILTSWRLENDRIFSILTDYYYLESDFEFRYDSLKGLPMRYRWLPPRYLYRYKQ